MNDHVPANTRWHKSSHSSGNLECVEVAFLDDATIGIRDSKNPTGPALRFASNAWESFTAGIQNGELALHRVAAE
ncbi:DUF397 domain-containing protein [Nocardia callitridis]|uniref:DUF397 domain-containing protein n=1 Tax=Nocardia callitridis TaxID=648753 RepID=A0ABP9KVE7_9NOCA